MKFNNDKLWLFFVSVPPHKIVITDETGQERTSVVGPYAEGAELHLRCLVYGGNFVLLV